MRDCDKCGGTGKLRTIAAVGAPSQSNASVARERFVAEVRPGDHVVCGSDHAQMLSGEAGVSHTRERVLSDEEIVRKCDVTVDLADPPQPLSAPPPPLRVKAIDVTPTPVFTEPEPVTEREPLTPRKRTK